MTPELTDRERALVDICRKVFKYNGAGIVWPSDPTIANTMLDVLDALRAYDPPKPKRQTCKEFVSAKMGGPVIWTDLQSCFERIADEIDNLRELTAKEQE